jgi:hypothetical protein
MRVHKNSTLAKILLPKRAIAFTFGDHVFCKEERPAPITIAHEFVHVTQYRRMGILLFLFRYIWFQITHGYDLNPLEVEARAGAPAVVARWRTDMARKGHPKAAGWGDTCADTSPPSSSLPSSTPAAS